MSRTWLRFSDSCYLIVEPYKVTSSSMEGKLNKGDYILISKFEFGARIPDGVKFPFVDYGNLLFRSLDIKPFISFNLPHLRLPGVRSIKRDDIVAFNFPVEERDLISLRSIYLKRCVGLPGDTVQLVKKQVYINGERRQKSRDEQHLYRVKLSVPLAQVVDEVGLYNISTQFSSESEVQGDTYEYLLHLSDEIASKFRVHPSLQAIDLDFADPNVLDLDIYPHAPHFAWNLDNVGPFLIPKKGLTLVMNPNNVLLYGPIIENYEDQAIVAISNSRLFINGHAVEKYTFVKDYYYVLGDNRNASDDSRRWGVVPDDHFIGRAGFVLHSKSRSFGVL